MRTRMLAVAFGPPTMAAACDGLARIREVADCVELRLDLFAEPFDLPTLLRARGDLPVVVTLRPPSQGGRSPLAPDERLKTLLRAAELGAEYVDVEFDALTPRALAALHAAGAEVIVSRHDFAAMPDLANDWWPRLADLGADVVKVVGTAASASDSLVVLRTLARATLPTIAIGMGEAGLPTRVLALRSDRCVLTYAALEEGVGTAPGQISVGDMREVYQARRVGPATRVFGLLGPHVERERLRDYNTWFADATIDAVAVPFPTSADPGVVPRRTSADAGAAPSQGSADAGAARSRGSADAGAARFRGSADAGAARSRGSVDAAEIVGAFRELPVDGWHIHGETLQREVVRALDDVSPAARRQAKVNGVVRRADGGLLGEWVETPREQFELWVSQR